MKTFFLTTDTTPLTFAVPIYSIHPDNKTGFAATGQLSVTNAGTFPYTYNANDSTFNSITLSGMSRDIAQRDSNMYPVVRRYHTYYDLFDYADEFVRAALQAAPTTELQRGRSSFAQAGYNGRNSKFLVLASLWCFCVLCACVFLCISSCSDFCVCPMPSVVSQIKTHKKLLLLPAWWC